MSTVKTWCRVLFVSLVLMTVVANGENEAVNRILRQARSTQSEDPESTLPPSEAVTNEPSVSKSPSPAPSESSQPSTSPSLSPTTSRPSSSPTTSRPSSSPTTSRPSKSPSTSPTTSLPTQTPSRSPTTSPTTSSPSKSPSESPSSSPTIHPTHAPSASPSRSPTTSRPTKSPSKSPTTSRPSSAPTGSPSMPTGSPTFRKKANIMLIIADDLKPLLSVYGLPYTDPNPGMEFIARRGITFMNAHAQFSLCGPSRASFLTSLRPDKLKIWNVTPNQLTGRIRRSRGTVRKIETLPEWFKANGYATYGVGKIFHENEKTLYTNPLYWTEPVYTWMNIVRSPSFVKPYIGSWIHFPDVGDEEFPDGQLTNIAVGLIKSKLAEMLDKPWFLMVGFFKPHLPFQCPIKYYNMSSDEEAPKAGNPSIRNFPANWLSMAKGDACNEINLYSGIKTLSWKSPENQQRSATRAYRATVAYIDAQVVKLLEALEESNQMEDTHVVFLGDHGFHLGDKGVYCKHTNFEQGVRVPFMIMPALREKQWDASRGKQAYAPVELLDLFPTLVDLTELPRKYGPKQGQYLWQGWTLRPILENPDAGFIKTYATSQFWRGRGSTRKVGYTIRTTRYRLTTWCPAPFKYNAKKCFFELYDFLADPGETTNMASALPEIRNRLFNIWRTVETEPSTLKNRPFDLDDRVALSALRQPFA